MSDFIELINKVGLPIAVLVFISYALWVSGSWLGKEILKPFLEDVAKPVAARHVSFVDGLANRDREQTEVLTNISTDLTRVREMATGHFEACEMIHKAKESRS